VWELSVVLGRGRGDVTPAVVGHQAQSIGLPWRVGWHMLSAQGGSRMMASAVGYEPLRTWVEVMLGKTHATVARMVAAHTTSVTSIRLCVQWVGPFHYTPHVRPNSCSCPRSLRARPRRIWERRQYSHQ
jgi:hypothetical protein